MVYKYINPVHTYSDNCEDWERHFRVCMQQPRPDARLFIKEADVLVINEWRLREVEQNTDWAQSVVRDVRQASEPFFILKRKKNRFTDHLHKCPNYVVEGIDLKVFAGLAMAFKYAQSLRFNEAGRIWMLCGDKFELVRLTGPQQ